MTPVEHERELCCQDICPACAVAEGATIPAYHFWQSMEPAFRTSGGRWQHEALYANGAILRVGCDAHAIRERAFHQAANSDTEDDRDAWRQPRRCPACHDDATAYRIDDCPTCLGEGWIK